MPRAKTPAKKEPRSRPLSLSDLDHNAVPRPGRKVQTDVRISKGDAEKALKMTGVRPLDERIDVTKPYYVISLIEKNPEIFNSPRGRAMIDPNERKMSNGHHLTLRKQHLDKDNKWGMVENDEVMIFPMRTDEWAAEHDYPMEDVNRALYNSKCCYPHRGAFYRMFEASDVEIEIGNEADFDLVEQIRTQSVNSLRDIAEAQGRAGGAYMGRPGAEQTVSSAALLTNSGYQNVPGGLVENQDVLDDLVSAGMKIELEPA